MAADVSRVAGAIGDAPGASGAATNVVLVGVSVPRSGHHFLAALLQHVFAADVSYCEFYGNEACCRRIPCVRGSAHLVTYQKNHDLDLSVDPHLPGVRYVVQFRHPVAAVISDRELFAAVRGERLAADGGQYQAFLAEKGAHFTRFYDKWIRRTGPGVFPMPYERLASDPALVLDELFRFCGLAVDPDRLARAVASVAPVLNRTPLLAATATAAFVPRVPTESAYFDRELLTVYESIVLDRVPELAGGRMFAPVDYRAHPLFALFNIQGARLDGHREEVARLAHAAHTAWPDHLYVNFFAGDALRTLGQHDAALPYLETAARLAPHDAEILVACANAHVALQQFDRAAALATSLAALAPADPSHRLFLATILTMAGRWEDALRQATHALELGIAAPHLWRAFGDIVHAARREGWTLQVTPQT